MLTAMVLATSRDRHGRRFRRGHVPWYFYKRLGTGGPCVENSKPNCTDHHESAHQNDHYLWSQKVEGHEKKFFPALRAGRVPPHHFQIRSGAAVYIKLSKYIIKNYVTVIVALAVAFNVWPSIYQLLCYKMYNFKSIIIITLLQLFFILAVE